VRRVPERRQDGTCVVCRKLIRVTPRSGLSRALYEVDPFCSAVCCRKWFGVADSPKVERA